MAAVAIMVAGGCKAALEALSRDAGVEAPSAANPGENMPSAGEPAAAKRAPSDDDFVQPARPGATGLAAGSYRITEVSVKAASKTASGSNWDGRIGRKPDLKIELLVDGKRVHTCEIANEAFESGCTLDHLFKLGANTKIALVVSDYDATSDNERVGKAAISDLLTSGQLGTPLKMATRDQLEWAYVTIIAVPEPTPLLSTWARYKLRVLGLAAGVVLALFMILLFRGFLWPRDQRGDPLLEVVAEAPAPGQVVKVRCPFCSALNDETDNSCGKCGGSL